MKNKIAQTRKPKLISLSSDLKELNTLIPGDTINIYHPHPLENCYGVPRGHDYYGIYEEKVDDWLSFLRLDNWMTTRERIYSIKINTDPKIIGKFIESRAGNLLVPRGAFCNESGGFYEIFSDEKFWRDFTPKKDFQRKVRLLQTGKKLVEELFTFDKVTYTDSSGKVIREDKNSILPWS